MIRARAAAAILIAGLAPACAPNLTELLPPADAATPPDGAGVDAPPSRTFNFCPTTMDVYGGLNVALVGSGGLGMIPPPIDAGYFKPGSADYDATLAGRLQARLAADPDLVARFGSTWKVRSCAANTQTLASLGAPIPADQCAMDSPQMMGMAMQTCLQSPARVALLVADDFDDRCHGGGRDSMQPDDMATYVQHFVARIDSFLQARQPPLFLLGPETEWHAPLPPPNIMPPPPFDPGSCRWMRPAWGRMAVMRWQTMHGNGPNVFVFPDAQEQFKPHHRCCMALGIPCQPNWFAMAPTPGEAVDLDGAQAVVDIWYARVKDVLLNNQFTCP